MKGLDPALGPARRGLGHHDSGRRAGGLHSRRGPHSRRSRPCQLTSGRRSSLCWALPTRCRQASAAAGAPAPELHLLTFLLDREEFGMPITRVREVIRVNGITRVPQVPRARARRDQPPGAHPRRGRDPDPARPRAGGDHAGVPDRGGGSARPRARPAGGPGVAGDQGAGGEPWRPRPTRCVTAETDYLTGVARWDSRLIILLDLDKVLLLNRVAWLIRDAQGRVLRWQVAGTDDQGLDDPAEDPHRLRRRAGADRRCWAGRRSGRSTGSTAPATTPSPPGRSSRTPGRRSWSCWW